MCEMLRFRPLYDCAIFTFIDCKSETDDYANCFDDDDESSSNGNDEDSTDEDSTDEDSTDEETSEESDIEYLIYSKLRRLLKSCSKYM